MGLGKKLGQVKFVVVYYIIITFFAEGVDGLLLVYLPLVNYIVKLIRNSNKQTLNLNYLQTKLLHSCKLRPIMLSVSQDLYFINVTCNDPFIS